MVLKISLLLIRLAVNVRAFLPSCPYEKSIGGLIHQRISKSLGREMKGRIRLVPPLRSPRSLLRAWTDGEDQFIAQQRSLSNSVQNINSDSTIETETDHLHHQKQVFDGMASTFASGATLSDDLIPAYRQIAQTVVGNATGIDLRILDVACGAGGLWPFLLEEGVSGGMKSLDVVGVDLSSQMVAASKSLANELALKHEGLVTFQAVESDIKSFCDGQSPDSFQVAVVNACFGNFWDPFAVLSCLGKVISDAIIVSHPLGAAFVEKLHEQDSHTVPHRLPTTVIAWQSEMARQRIPLRVHQLKLDLNGDPFYLAYLKKTRAVALPSVLRFSGTVDRGYGRGGKKLGFPTANLPSRLFQGALEAVPTGVYFGWAMVAGRVHKAVVNVGFSPTFEGQENQEKIIEAHMILDSNEALGDFYDQSMKLLLLGFLRPEMKFPSFPALVAQIKADVVDSKDVLEDEIYQKFRSDKMFTNAEWQGSSSSGTSNSGIASASWEFQPFVEAML